MEEQTQRVAFKIMQDIQEGKDDSLFGMMYNKKTINNCDMDIQQIKEAQNYPKISELNKNELFLFSMDIVKRLF